MKFKTKMRESDYTGHRADPYDCPGHKAFKRALPWYIKYLVDTRWLVNSGGKKRRWQSFDGQKLVSMVSETQPRDIITFKKVK